MRFGLTFFLFLLLYHPQAFAQDIAMNGVCNRIVFANILVDCATEPKNPQWSLLAISFNFNRVDSVSMAVEVKGSDGVDWVLFRGIEKDDPLDSTMSDLFLTEVVYITDSDNTPYKVNGTCIRETGTAHTVACEAVDQNGRTYALEYTSISLSQ
jgi:hypothetical protein